MIMRRHRCVGGTGGSGCRGSVREGKQGRDEGSVGITWVIGRNPRRQTLKTGTMYTNIGEVP